jgi:hypothetical protein
MNCYKCNHKIINSEHYIELEYGSIVCEDCFIEIALKYLNAKLKQNNEEN